MSPATLPKTPTNNNKDGKENGNGKTARTNTATSETKGLPVAGIAAALIVAAVVAAIILALALGGTGDEAADSAAADSARIPTSGALRQVSFVEADSALPRFDASLPLDPAVGQPAPVITASYFDNTETTIDFSDGQPRAVLFFAHWCPHCQAEVQELVARFEGEGIRDDVEIVAISTNVDQGAPNYPPSRWFLAEEWPIPVLRDSANSDLAAAFGLSGFPFMAVVDGDGNIVARQSGAVPASQWDMMLDLSLAS